MNYFLVNISDSQNRREREVFAIKADALNQIEALAAKARATAARCALKERSHRIERQLTRLEARRYPSIQQLDLTKIADQHRLVQALIAA